MNTSLIATALPSIARDVHVSLAGAGLLVAVLYLVSAVAQPVMGRLCDAIGPRPVLLCGGIVTILGGLLGALGSSFAVLLVARALIGVGTSTGYPASITVLSAHGSSERARRRALSVISAAMQSSLAAGLALGGLLVASVGWRAIFLINVPAAAVAVVLTLTLVSPAPTPRAGGRTARIAGVDVAGVCLFSLALGSLFLGLYDVRAAWPLLLAVPVLVVAFIWVERRARSPFIPISHLIGSSEIVSAHLRMFLTHFAIYSVLYGLSQWLEEVQGYGAAAVGLLMLPLALAAMAASSAARWRGSTRRLLVITAGGVFVGAGAIGAMAVFGATSWAALCATAIFGLALGLGPIANQSALLAAMPEGGHGAAAGLLRTSGYCGAAAASVLIGVLSPSGRALELGGLAAVLAVTGAVLITISSFGTGAAGWSRRGRARTGRLRTPV